jgi:hypothetical protein
VGIDGEGVTKEGDLTIVVAATQEDDLATGMGLQVKLKVLREGPSLGSAFSAPGGASLVSVGVEARLLLQARQALMLEALPDVGLPVAIVVLDGGLEAKLTRRHKHGHDGQLQAQSANRADGIRMLMRSLKEGIVIELGVAGQPPSLPVLKAAFSYQGGREVLFGPGGSQVAVKRSDVEHPKLWPVFYHQPLDRIPKIQFREALSHIGQIPAPRRGWEAHSTSGVKDAAPLEDALDGALTGQLQKAKLKQMLSNGSSTIVAKGILLFEILACLKHLSLKLLGIAPRWALGSGPVAAPVHRVKSLALGSLYPMLQRTQADTKGFGHRAQRLTLSHRCYHVPTLALTAPLFAMLLASSLDVSSIPVTA